MDVKEQTSVEEWRVRRRWLVGMIFGVAMLVGAVVDSVVLPMLIVLVTGVRAMWLFHRHRIRAGDHENTQ